MKILKYILSILAILCIIFLALGFITPSVSYTSETTVNKSAKEAWAVMSDEENLPKWIKGFKRAELVSGKANSVGAVSNIYIDENGKEMVMKETVTAVKDYEHLAMTFSMDFMDMDYEMIFTEKDGKTHIQTNSKTIGNGMLAKSIVSMMSATMKKQEDENVNTLKKLIEENTKIYFQEEVEEEMAPEIPED